MILLTDVFPDEAEGQCEIRTYETVRFSVKKDLLRFFALLF